METIYYLAVDIGASSGRHILGWTEDGKLRLREVYRFENGMRLRNGHKCWDTEALFASIKEGMKKCKELNMVPSYMGIDTWGVDYVLLDGEGNRVGDAIGYRDDRTAGMDEAVYRLIPEQELYARTGSMKASFNTIFQLMAEKEQTPERLAQAESMLLTPDYYSYLLTGVKGTEYTIASTTQLLNPLTKDWDWELIETLGFPKKIFKPIHAPGTLLAPLSEAIAKEVGFCCQVVSVCSHDTASAVLAVPFQSEDSLYISSGTWSLMGTELDTPILTEESRLANFTNEGGYGYNVRYLKNIMGLWMIQSVRNELGKACSFGELCSEAERANITSLVDCNDGRFFAPNSMIEALQGYCAETHQQVPQTPGELASVIYRSLAQKYAETVKELEAITHKQYHTVHIVGGGCNAAYLNRLTAEATGCRVPAGPGECTAIGNVACQMLSSGAMETVSQVRDCIYRSFEIA